MKRINIRGEDAIVRTLPKRAQQRLFPNVRGRVVMRKERWDRNKNYSNAMAIAWLLFPKHFPTIIASARKAKGITFSKQAQLTRQTQSVIDFYYESARQKSGYHLPENKEQIDKAHQSILRKAGIEANTNHMNAGIRGKTPIFFEVWGVDYKKLQKYVKALPEETQKQRLVKKQALVLLAPLKEAQDHTGQVYCHRG